MLSIRFILFKAIFSVVHAATFEEDLHYISLVYPEVSTYNCPNLPPYGGLASIGPEAIMCSSAMIYDEESDGVLIFDDGWTMNVGQSFEGPIDPSITHPVVLQWNRRSTSPEGHMKHCPKSTCFFTENRNWINNSLTQVVQFYGTIFKITDLPLPRQAHHLWALAHEESPKNTLYFSYKDTMELFNVTATFKRESSFPITTQYIRSVEQIESKKWMKSFEEKNRYGQEEDLAPIVYVQSDCGAPSDRDNIVKMIMKYIKVDAYGVCLHNKDLPGYLIRPIGGMEHEDFLQLISKYKFAISMENGICKDYITEKFWRPLVVGTVPIVYGSPNITDFVPSDKSIIHLRDFNSIKDLVALIKHLSADEKAYESYRAFKRTGISNEYLRQVLKHRSWDTDFDIKTNLHNKKGNYVDHFDCMLCDIANDRAEGSQKRRGKLNLQATKAHYGCPLPTEFTDENNLSKTSPFSDFWHDAWIASYCELKAFMKHSNGGRQAYNISAMKDTMLWYQKTGAWRSMTLE